MQRRWWLAGGAAGLVAAGAVAAAGLRQVPVWSLVPAGTAVDLPWQRAVGLDTGINGRRYGPLAFVSLGGGRFLVADSYRHRLLEVTGSAVRGALPLPDSVVETLTVGPHGRIYAGDNLNVRVFTLNGGRREWALGRPTRTGAVWSLAPAPGGGIYASTIHVGRGEIRGELARYGADGSLKAVLAERTVGPQGVPRPAPAGPLDAFVSEVAAGAGGRCYALLEGGGPRERTVAVWGQTGAGPQTVRLQLPAPAQRAELLGVDGAGRLYLAVDMPAPAPRLEVFTPAGRFLAGAALPAEAAGAAVYGQVRPGGTCYLVENTARAYRIVRWRVAAGRRWEWRL